MINFYKFTLRKNHKTKLVFYSKNNLNLRVDFLEEENNYKNLQKIKLNKKQTLTIRKRFTLDWHTRPNNNLISAKIFKNQRFLKLASFYSQLNSTNFSKKFTSLMILNLKTEMQDFNQPNLKLFNVGQQDNIPKKSNSSEGETNTKIFSNLKDKLWFSQLFMPFSNRNYWWILLPTRSILTHIRWKIYSNQITNRFTFYQPSVSSKEFSNSTVLFDSFPEFLMEKPISWYWMLPFFGCLGLVANNINFSYFENYYPTKNFQNKVNFNVYSTFSSYQIQNSISWEMFQFFNYKKLLFDSSLKYLNKVSLNNDTLLIQIKKTWLSRQKEHYICNYEDNLIKKNFNKNFNKLSKLKTLNWWKINWEKITSQTSQYHSIKFQHTNLKKNPYLLYNFDLNLNKKSQFYCFDSLFYSKFSWYWHILDTRNINDFFNLNYSNLIYKKIFQDIQPFYFQKVLTDSHSTFFYPFSINSISSSNSVINEFPLKIQFSWLVDDFKNNKINQKKNIQINKNFDSIPNKLNTKFQNIEINVLHPNNNNKQYSNNLIEFQIKKLNLKFKKLLLLNTYNATNFNDAFFPSVFINFKNSTKRKSSFIFCISSKKESIINPNELSNLQLIKEKAQIYETFNDINKKLFDNIIFHNKQRVFSNLTLYNGIGCEILESEFNPIYGWNEIQSKNLKQILDQPNHHFLQMNKKLIHNNFKKNQSIFSFHKASFLLNNCLSKFYFELGLSCLTTEDFINYFFKILNLKKLDSNNGGIFGSTFNYEKLIQNQKKPILMSGYYLPHSNGIFQEKNKNQINEIRCHLPPNLISNQLKFNKFFKSNEPQSLKTDLDSTLNKDLCFSLIKKQNLCIINKKLGKINSKSKKFEHFVMFNLVKSLKNSLSRRLQINIKTMQYGKKFFNIKTSYKYPTVRLNFLINNQLINYLQNKSLKENKIQKNITKHNGHSSLLLLNYSNPILKEKIRSILIESVFPNNSQKKLFSSSVFSESMSLPIKKEQKKFFTYLTFNIIPKYSYVANKSIFWNYINSTYNSSGLLNTDKPFIFEKFNQFIKTIRMNLLSRNNNNFQNSNYFSNLLLQKYQRKSKNWPGGSEPRGFFYKRINKLNFKQIQKKYNIEQSDKRKENVIGSILNDQVNIIKQLKNVSSSKPVAELLWEVRTKHKIPEVLLIQQTLFFQKKLVRKSTEEKNIVNQYSSRDEGLKFQTLLRKMTQRRNFRKHVFLETLFNWTRDAISLRKMLRKIYFKNNWQAFLKYIFKSKNSLVVSDYYSNWHKKTKNQILIKYHFLSDSFNPSFNRNSEKVIKIKHLRPFFSNFSNTQNNKKFFQSKDNIYFILKDFYKNIPINLNSVINRNNNKLFSNFHFKKTEKISHKKFKNFKFSSLKQRDFVSKNPLILPEWKIFSNLPLLNLFIEPKFQKLIEKRNNIQIKSSFMNYDSLDPLSLILINRVNINQDNYFSNGLNSFHFINQRHLSRIGFPLYKMSHNNIVNFENKNNNNAFNINKKLYNYNRKPSHFTLSPPIFNNNLLKDKKSNYRTKFESKQLNSFFNFHFSNIFNFSLYNKNFQYKNYQNINKFFEISKFNLLEQKVLEKNVKKNKLNFYSNKLSIRYRLLYQKLYFNNLLWNSTDFFLNTNSTIFTENQIIKNFIKQNWVFQTRPIYSHNFFDKELNFNFNNLLATLSTWQSKFQIKRDLILQIFYVYLDHSGAFINYIIKNIILDNTVNQLRNWNLFKDISIIKTKESIKQNQNLLKLEKDFLTKPTWSFDLFKHIKTQYPHLYNQIQNTNQSNFNNIQGFYTLIKTPEFQSKSELILSPNFKTKLPLIYSFKTNSAKNIGFFKNYNMLSNIYNHSLNQNFINQSMIKKLSSQSLIIQNSTLFSQKWIQNRQVSNFLKIEFLKKQQKLRQILNIIQLKKDQIKQNSNTTFFKDFAYKRKNFIEKKTIGFKRRSGFLFTRSLITRNFNSFSSFSKVTQTSFSVYLNTNSENISIRNFIFFVQLLLLHICLIFCLITVYQSAFHFCFKSIISISVILVHSFLNIKYRFKRLIKYVYQSTIKSLITNFYSSDSLHHKLFVSFNNLLTAIFYKKFSIWGKIYKSSIPSLTNFLFKNPFFNSNYLKPINFINYRFDRSKNDLILSERIKIQKFNNLESFFDDIELNQFRNRRELDFNFQFDLIPKKKLLKIMSQKKENHRMSLLRNTNFIQKQDFVKLRTDLFFISNERELEKGRSEILPWEKDNLNINKKNLLNRLIKNKRRKKNDDSSIFQLSFKLLKWNLGLILLIGESEIFAELEPYREMHWYFLKRLPIFLRSNISLDDPINMYDYQADEKLRKFKEQFKKSTEIFQKRQNTIERKTERNRKKEHVKQKNSSHMQYFQLINKKNSNTNNLLTANTLVNSDNIILFIKDEKQFNEKSVQFFDTRYINKIANLLNNFDFLRKKISRGQPFWKPVFSFLAYTLFVSRLAKLNRRFRDSVLIINNVWIAFGPLNSILFSFLWKNWILNFSTLLDNKNYSFNKLQISAKNYKTKTLLNSLCNINKLHFSEIVESQYKLSLNHNLKRISAYSSPFQLISFNSNKTNCFESKQFTYEIQNIWENINYQNNKFSQLSPPLLNRVFLWNFVKFEKKYQRTIKKWSNIEKNKTNDLDFFKLFTKNTYLQISKNSINIINKYKSLYINNQEQSAQNRYIHYKTYDPKVRLYRFYTNFSKNLSDIGIIEDAKNVHPLFGSLFCEIYSGVFSSATNSRTQSSGIYNKFTKPLSFFSSTKNILLVGNTNSSNFVLLVQAFAAETGLKLFMEDAKRLRRLGRRGINKSTKRLEKLFEIAQAHSPSIVFLEDIDVIGSKRRITKINEEEDDDDMAIRSFFSKLIYRKQHNYKSLRQSFIHQNLFISNEEAYRNLQKSIIPESPIPSNLIEYQLTRRKAFSNYFSNTSNSSYKTFITKFNALKSSINGNFSNNLSSSPTNTVIIWKLLKSKLVTPKKTIKETPWKHIPVDAMRSIPLITYSIRVKVAKLTMLAIYTMNTQLRLVKDLIKLLEKIHYESYKGFIVFATTNKLAILDPSLRRPGRFDETVYLPSLTVNSNYQRFSSVHFLNVLSTDSQDFVNFSRTFNILDSMNFAIDWNLNSVYGNVFIQDNSEKIFYPTRTSLRDLINLTASNVYNQNIFMQNENNIYHSFIPFDILGNIGFQKPSFSIYSKSALLLSLAYSKAGQLIIKLFFQEKNSLKNSDYIKLNNSNKNYNKIAFNSENNQLTIWPNSHIYNQFKKINISYTSRNRNIKKNLIHFFAGKIGEYCFFSFYKHQNNFQKGQMHSNKKIKILFEKNVFGLRSLYGIQPDWKNMNSVIFSLIRTSCLYSKNHLTSKLLYLDDISKKRQRIFSENFGPSLLFEYFNLNTESFLKRNTIPLDEHLQKQQTQKYLLNLQQKPLRKYLSHSTLINKSKNYSYLNKIANVNRLSIEKNQVQEKNSQRLALFRILFNELGSLDLITLRPTAMNYYYDKKIYQKQRFKKYTYKWWNWHLKKTIDSLEEFQYLDFFPYADKQYNPRRQRWMLTNGYSAYWLAQEKILYYQIYEQLIIECFQISYLQLDKHREMLDYLVQLLMTKQLLTEIQWILFFKRFV